jgi:hypothetical protein
MASRLTTRIAEVPGGPDFSDIPGLWAYYDPDRGYATAGVLSDQSGNARDATQASAPNRLVRSATGLNGRPCWVSDGAAAYFWNLPSLAGLNAAGGEMFQVLQADAFPPAVQQFAGGVCKWGTCVTIGEGNVHTPWTDGSFYDDFGCSTRVAFTTGGVNLAAAPVIYSAYATPAERQFFLNGVSKYLEPAPAIGFSTAPRLGYGMLASDVYYFKGKLGITLLFSGGKLSSGNRLTVLQRLSSYYSL